MAIFPLFSRIISFLEHPRKLDGGRSESETKGEKVSRREKVKGKELMPYVIERLWCWFRQQTILISMTSITTTIKFTGSFAWHTYRWRSMRRKRVDFYTRPCQTKIYPLERPNVLTHWNIYVDLLGNSLIIRQQSRID